MTEQNLMRIVTPRKDGEQWKIMHLQKWQDVVTNAAISC